MLITGTRKGIGRFLVEHYTLKGFMVEGCSRKESNWTHPAYHHHIADVSDESQVKGVIESIRSRHDRLDVLISNAGIASMNHFLLMPERMAAAILNTNLKGTFLVCRESAKLMQKNRYGRIVTFSTVAVPLNLDGEALYAASKSGVETFTRVIARELASFGITCNVIGPAPVLTDLIRSVPQEKIDRILDRLAIKRLGRFEDIARVIDFFIDPASEYITGQTIYLGGIG
jgi:3-oxoacyl-[acyl-carrier protein] reductase